MISNAANAQTVLKGAFDINLHKSTFINYLEVVISPDGTVEYAVPSHVEKLLSIYMRQNHITDREEAISLLERESLLIGYVECLTKQTGYISVWNNSYIAGRELTRKQFNALKTLRLHGLYRGIITRSGANL